MDTGLAGAVVRPGRFRTEQPFHEALADMFGRVILPPAMWCHYPAGSVPLPRAYAAKLYRMGLKRSWPDFMFIHAGRIYGLDAKADKGRLSKSRNVKTTTGKTRFVEGQEEIFPKLVVAGFTAIEPCWTIDEALIWLRAWQVPMLGVTLSA